MLAPKMVHLVYKDTPLSEAIEDFSKKSGYTLVLRDPDDKMKDTKITIDTGKVTFWSALEQFCAKAGLIDDDPNAARFAGGGFPGGGAIFPGGGGRAAMIPGGGARAAAPGAAAGGVPVEKKAPAKDAKKEDDKKEEKKEELKGEKKEAKKEDVKEEKKEEAKKPAPRPAAPAVPPAVPPVAVPGACLLGLPRLAWGSALRVACVPGFRSFPERSR